MSGISSETVTAGFRLYSGGKRKESAIALVAEPRVLANPKWVAQQKKRLAKKYESYWYTTEKGEWTKHEGWPTEAESWKRIQAWIVRKKMKPSAATSAILPERAREDVPRSLSRAEIHEHSRVSGILRTGKG